MKTRICTKCGEEKPETAEYFPRAKTSRGGLNTTCKVCCNKNARKWRLENLERERENGRRWRAENPEKLRERIKRSKKRQVDTLLPCYLKTLIANKYGISHSEIGDELINAKRREIRYYRQFKQLKQLKK